MTEARGIRESLTRSEMIPVQVAVTDDLSTTPAVDVRGGDGFGVRATNSDVTTLTIYGADAEAGTYTAIQHQGFDITLTLSTSKFVSTEDFQSGCFPFRWVKLVGNAAGLIDIVGTG